MLTALFNLKLITNGSISSGKAILIDGKQISAIVDSAQIPADAQQVDLQGAYVAPGLIDLQIYGSGGKMFGSLPEVAALQQMESDMLSQGTTGFFACMATNSNEVVEAGITAAKAYRAQAKGSFWGLHLEGPYLNARRKGAHPEKYIKKATLAEVQRWVEMAEGEIKMMTIAPELQDQEVIDYLHSQNIVISSGHSDATYEQAKAFINNPIQAITHLYNAMPQMHHREPGIIPAIFEERPYTSVVADGIHVSFPMIRLAKRQLGDKLFLITDAVTAATEGAYQHQFTGDRYTMPDGTLSGSCLTMLKAVQNCVEQVGIELAEAINMASLYPAQLAGQLTKGKIAAGYDADLIIFNPGYEVQGAYLLGQSIHINK
ncbi:N-acetylglucosamine-6-phosphate deacetylase [Mucilaginibacter koreensis]